MDQVISQTSDHLHTPEHTVRSCGETHASASEQTSGRNQCRNKGLHQSPMELLLEHLQ